MNYFDSPSAAARYARGRPAYHAVVIDRLRARLGLREPVPRAIDVGCGTGLSTLALRAVANQVIGLDRSPHMLAHAQRPAAVHYVLAPAEQLPLAAGCCDLMTLAQAFHWLDRGAFLAEAWRLLLPGAWLVVYDHYFTGHMAGSPGFVSWVKDQYAQRYPRPPRGSLDFGPEDARQAGFALVGEETYQNPVPFTVASLADYLTTHSNVIAAVEGGSEPLESARDWLTDGVAPHFQGQPVATLLFSGPIWYLRRQ